MGFKYHNTQQQISSMRVKEIKVFYNAYIVRIKGNGIN